MLPATCKYLTGRIWTQTQRPLVQARWNSSGTNGEQSPVTPNAEKETATGTPLDGILSVLGNSTTASSEQSTDSVSNVLNESVQKQRQSQANDGAAGGSKFDMLMLSSSLTGLGQVPHQIHINATLNNTIITLTRPNGAPLVTTSGGSVGFKKAARSGYEAAHQAALQLLEKMHAKNLQVNTLHMVLKGFGPGRDAAFKALVSGHHWNVKRVTDATPMPFGGCRPKKARRL
ncbi:uncharacterized protein BYT42DRAFT_561122 [Radiomyces spectabilis]|uniref:uncharacterized protein n=1 Tax=Radiomyces spectabilis TaxID=64574 RepID=UPI00221F8B3F|nr:uncharacterized protein BYT42DRAFT_561122 [Radiomyces spectabilis]KAI8388756.1 hypothetical protein BYT42DRAFT_561122 [Radiomyces spectabilis]